MSISITQIGKDARLASRQLTMLSGEVRQHAIAAMPAKLQAARDEVMNANAVDVQTARDSGMPEPLVKRLAITDKIFDYMMKRLLQVAALPDPVNRVLEGHTRPNGLQVQKISTPIGVVGMIYESRPNVTTDAASVCLKSGNAVILRGGSESLRTNTVLADAMIEALVENDVPENALQIIREPGHASVDELLGLDEYIDVLIPRGGSSLIERIAKGTRIPVIKHYEGVCHLYLAEDAPEDMAVNLAVNSKTQRVEVCNALETLLVDEKSAQRLLPAVKKAFDAKDVEIRGCDATRKILPGIPAATDDDWHTEYLAPILSVRIVSGVDEAIQHINTYGSGHTDSICTLDNRRARRFVDGVDAASVLVNASTRLSGGGDYGLGAVVGISTDKLHARGPVGPNELTSYKWVAFGDGHLRD